MFVARWLWLWCVCGGAAVVRAQVAEWSVVSAVSLSPVEAPHNGSEFRLAARLRVEVEWSAAGGGVPTEDRLLRFQLSGVTLQTRRGAEWAPRGSVWTRYAGGALWARLQRGRVEHVWLSHDQPAYYTNYERALVSLFQFQVSADAEFWNETDVAGECSGFYEQVAPLVYRKIKRTCVWEGEGAGAGEDEQAVTSRRVTRVELAPGSGVKDILAANLIVHEEETRAAGAGAGAGAGVRARAWLRLERVSPPGPPAPAPPGPLTEPPAPLSSLLPDYTHHDHDHLEDDKTGPVELVALVGVTLQAVARGEQRFVQGAARVLPALERAEPAALQRLLDHVWEGDELAAVYRLLALSGSLAAWRVAARALALAAADAHHLAPHYLDALAHAHPEDGVVSALTALCGSARSAPVRAECGGAVGGAARHAGTQPRQEAVAYLLAELADCKEEARCVSAVVGAAAARCGACVSALRRVLATSEHTHARILACGALSGLPARELGAESLRALERVALALDRHEPVEVRGAALSAWLLVSARAAHRVGAAHLQHDVTLLFDQLARAGPSELLRLAWLQLEALGEELPCARAHVAALRMRPRLQHYYQPGMSMWVSREAWRVGARRVTVRGSGTARRGILRDARVELRLAPHGDGDAPLAALQLRTQGMHHVATEVPTKEEQLEWSPLEPSLEHEEPSAWLGAEAWGLAAQVPLFTSQGSLAAAVWSGAGSAWTRVRRAACRPRAGRVTRRVPSAAGVLLHVRAGSLHDLALHARAQVSLWSRSALLGAGAALCGRHEVVVSLGTAWGAARARHVSDACGALRVPATADFYQDVAVCARPDLTPLTIRSESDVSGSWGGVSSRRVVSSRVTHTARSVPLGADNDAQCRALAHHDEPLDEHELNALEALAL